MSKPNWNRRLNMVFASILCLILIFGVGTWVGYSFTGTTNTFAPGSLETATLNVTGDWYRGTTNLTGRLLGTWGALTSTTLDTGQGAYELYGMDQDMLTSSSPTFDDLTSTSLDTGHGANELYDMNQNVLTTSSPTFDDLTADGLTSSWIDLGGDNRTVWPTSAIPSVYDYFINWNGTHHRVWDGGWDQLIVREDLTDTHLDIAIENCLDDDAGRITIKLGPNCDGDGRVLNINRSRFALYTDLAQDHQGTYYTPRISKILFECDGTNEIRDVIIQGLSAQEWDFHANETSIQGITVDKCYMQTNSTYGGLIFRETDTLGVADPFIDWIRFIDFDIHDTRSQLVNGEGCITFQNKDDGTGQFWFERLKYHQTTVDDPVFMCFDTDSRVSPTIWITEPSFSIFGNNTVLFKLKSGTYLESLVIDSPWVEIKENFVMLEIDTGVKRCRLTMDNSQWSIGSDCNFSILNNSVVNYYDWHGTGYNGLFGEGNVISTSSAWTGTFNVGTLNLNKNFGWQWSYHMRYWNSTESEYIRMDHSYLSLSPHLGADHFYDGITTSGQRAGEALYFGDVVFLNSVGDWNETDADANTTMPAMGVMVDNDQGYETFCKILLQGYVRDDSKFNFATKGGFVYVSTTEGALTQTAPSGSGDQVQIAGYYVGDYTIYFDPNWAITAIP